MEWRGKPEKPEANPRGMVKAYSSERLRRLRRNEEYADRRRNVHDLPRWSELPAARVNGKNNDLIRILIGCKQVLAGRIDYEVAWGLSLRRYNLNLFEQSGSGINFEDRDAVVAPIRRIEKLT